MLSQVRKLLCSCQSVARLQCSEKWLHLELMWGRGGQSSWLRNQSGCGAGQIWQQSTSPPRAPTSDHRRQMVNYRSPYFLAFILPSSNILIHSLDCVGLFIYIQPHSKKIILTVAYMCEHRSSPSFCPLTSFYYPIFIHSCFVNLLPFAIFIPIISSYS